MHRNEKSTNFPNKAPGRSWISVFSLHLKDLDMACFCSLILLLGTFLFSTTDWVSHRDSPQKQVSQRRKGIEDSASGLIHVVQFLSRQIYLCDLRTSRRLRRICSSRRKHSSTSETRNEKQDIFTAGGSTHCSIVQIMFQLASIPGQIKF